MKQLSWLNFSATILVPGQQRVHLITASPRVEVFGDGIANRIGVWLEVGSNGAVVPPELERLSVVAAKLVDRDGRRYLEVATGRPELHRQFYHFVMAFCERMLKDKIPPLDALLLEFRCFSAMLAERAILGFERQLGLLGELIFLGYLVKRIGPRACDAWLGPVGEPHDFRVGNTEFEVKTTVSTRRVHTINGLEQLVPSAGCTLNLVSVLLGPAGDNSGFSLADKADELSRLLSPSVHHSGYLQSLIASGYRTEDAVHYNRRFAPRRPMGIVPVEPPFPAITRSMIQTQLGVDAPRIESVNYDVDVDGLEHEEGTASFEASMPASAT